MGVMKPSKVVLHNNINKRSDKTTIGNHLKELINKKMETKQLINCLNYQQQMIYQEHLSYFSIYISIYLLVTLSINNLKPVKMMFEKQRL